MYNFISNAIKELGHVAQWVRTTLNQEVETKTDGFPQQGA